MRLFEEGHTAEDRRLKEQHDEELVVDGIVYATYKLFEEAMTALDENFLLVYKRVSWCLKIRSGTDIRFC